MKVEVEYIENGIVQFLFSDSGLRKNIQNPDRIFQSLFSTKKNKKGTGLGLYHCQKMALNYGGSLELCNVRVNTTFILRLPSGEL